MRRASLHERYADWVKRIANGIHSNLPANPDVTAEDLEQHGHIGLLEAANRWNPNNGGKFTTFAYLRIRGAIYNSLRDSDPLPERIAVRHRELVRTRAMLAQLLHRYPTPIETAEALAVTPAELAELERSYWQHIRPISIETPVGSIDDSAATLGDTLAVTDSDPADLYLHAEDIADVRRRVANLPERDRLVIALHYGEGLTYTAIAERVGLSFQRIHQLHAAALERMRLDEPTPSEAPPCLTA